MSDPVNIFWIAVISLVIIGFCAAAVRDMNKSSPAPWRQRERR